MTRMKFCTLSTIVKLIRCTLFALALSANCGVALGNLLQNGNFNQPNSSLTAPAYETFIVGYSDGAESASAEGWGLWNNADTTTYSSLLPTDPFGCGYMIHIQSGEPICGLYQLFPQQTAASASVDVFVLSGVVRLSLFTGGGLVTLSYIDSKTTGVWETLTLPVTRGDPNELTLYTCGNGGEFYADRASVSGISCNTPVPDPGSTIVLLGFALASVAVIRRRPWSDTSSACG